MRLCAASGLRASVRPQSPANTPFAHPANTPIHTPFTHPSHTLHTPFAHPSHTPFTHPSHTLHTPIDPPTPPDNLRLTPTACYTPLPARTHPSSPYAPLPPRTSPCYRYDPALIEPQPQGCHGCLLSVPPRKSGQGSLLKRGDPPGGDACRGLLPSAAWEARLRAWLAPLTP